MGQGADDRGHGYEDPSMTPERLPPWLEFRNYVVDSVRYYITHPGAVFTEVLSGFMISILQVPESVAFSYVAGVHPMQGLYGSFFMGLITCVLGGRPGMISGCAGALAVVIKEVMLDNGPFGDKCPEERREYLFFVMVLTGIIQLVCAACRCANLVKLIPKTAFLGFFNGLAVVIFMSQLETFQKSPQAEDGNNADALGSSPVPDDESGCRPVDFGFRPQSEWYNPQDSTTWLMVVEVLIVMFFMEGIPLLPKIPMRKLGMPRLGKVSIAKVIPPSLIGLLLAMGYEWVILRPNGWSTPIVKDVSRIQGSAPPWHVPTVPWGRWDTWAKCLPLAASLAAIGLVESVLTLQAVDQLIDQQTPVPRKNQECVAQGLANLVSGFFMAMGGDAMIGQSTINILNGARGRLSAFVAACFLMLYIVLLGEFIEAVPTAALAGILFVVVIHTFNWASVSIIVRRALPLYMCATIVIVTVLSVFTNLAVGIGVGILWESVFFVWREGSQLGVTPVQSGDVKTYRVEGSLFFVNADEFNKHFSPNSDPRNVVIDFANSQILDFSALYTLNILGKRYQTSKKRLSLRMKQEDYRRYAAICDEKSKKKESILRRYLPTNATNACHGRVSGYQLQPQRYQEFDIPSEQIGRRFSKGRIRSQPSKQAFAEPADWPEGSREDSDGGLRMAAAGAEALRPKGKPSVTWATDGLVQEARVCEEDEDDEGSNASASTIMMKEATDLLGGGVEHDAVVDFNASSTTIVSLLSTDVYSPSPSAETIPEELQGVPLDQYIDEEEAAALPGALNEDGEMVAMEADEDDRSWVSEESV